MRYGIIGAGALGLTVAVRLAGRGHEVAVLEREAVPGGLAAGFEIEPGMWLEKFYHHLFRSDRFAVKLIEEVGLGEELHWYRPETTVFLRGAVYALDSPVSVLRFDPLAVPDRLRLAAGVGFLRVLPSADVLENKTAGRWMPRLMGRSAHEVVWEPLLRGKFGDHADRISMAWLWARIHCRTAQLGYIRGGFQQLYRALDLHVRELGGTITYGASATEIRGNRDGIEVAYRHDREDHVDGFDRLVSTLPTALTVRLTPDMPPDYIERHPSPQALGAHCLILSLDRPLTDVYWIGINDPELPFLAVVEHTNMVPPAAYGGRNLVYVGNYRSHDDPLMRWSKDEVIEAFTPGLRRLNPEFDPSWVRESWSFAAPFAQPVVTPAFARTIPGFDTPVKGLYVANMFQVYPYDRGQNYSIELADRLVRHLDA